MAHTTLNRALKGHQAACKQRVACNVQRSRTVQVVAKQYSGPPPAWDRRVVVPDVKPRDTPKVVQDMWNLRIYYISP